MFPTRLLQQIRPPTRLPDISFYHATHYSKQKHMADRLCNTVAQSKYYRMAIDKGADQIYIR